MAESRGVSIRVSAVLDEDSVRQVTRDMLPVIVDELRVMFVERVRRLLRF